MFQDENSWDMDEDDDLGLSNIKVKGLYNNHETALP